MDGARRELPGSDPLLAGEEEPALPAEDEGRRALLAALGYLLFYRLVPYLPFQQVSVIVVTTLLSLGVTLLFTVRCARALRSPRALAISLALAAIVTVPMVALPILARTIHSPTISSLYLAAGAVYRPLFRALPGAKGLLLIWLAVSLGVLVSRLVREFKMLLPMAVVLALVDLYVVFGGGLVTQAESGKSTVAAAAMKALTVELPNSASRSPAQPLTLAVGFADYLFIALFFACFVRFAIPSRRIFAVLYITLALYMTAAAFDPTPLPALVPIGIVIIAMCFRRFAFTRDERFAMLYAALLCAGLAVGYRLLYR